MIRTPIALAAVLLAFAAGPALAGEGFAGVYAHDVHDGLSLQHRESGSQQFVFGVRTAALDELSWIFKPHVHLLAGINDDGGTDYLAAGFDWRLKFAQRFYLEPGIGVTIHTGKVNLPSPYAAGISYAEATKRFNDQHTKLDLGSRVLFEPELALGWKATDRLSWELSWIHMSHAQLAGKQNPGLGDVGLRAVYRYGIDR